MNYAGSATANVYETERDEMTRLATWVRNRRNVAILTRYNEGVANISAALLAMGLRVVSRSVDTDRALFIDALRLLAKHTPYRVEDVEFLAQRLGARFEKLSRGKPPMHLLLLARDDVRNGDVVAALVKLGFPPDKSRAVALGMTAEQALESCLAGSVSTMGVSGPIEVTTIHQAKGREWEDVALACCNYSPRDHEEAKRLFYVAMTRAKRDFLVTSHRSVDWNSPRGYNPSPFMQFI